MKFSTFSRFYTGPLSISDKLPKLNVSYKPQQISPKSTCTVRQLLHNKIRDFYVDPKFVTDVMKPLKIPELFDQEVCKTVRYFAHKDHGIKVGLRVAGIKTHYGSCITAVVTSIHFF